MKKIFWFSRHPLSALQMQAVREIHGETVEISHDTTPFSGIQDFLDRLEAVQDGGGFAYIVAPAHYFLIAAQRGLEFGCFENSPVKRQDGQFGLSAVWHTTQEPIESLLIDAAYTRQVWTAKAEETAADSGDALTPVKRA